MTTHTPSRSLFYFNPISITRLFNSLHIEINFNIPLPRPIVMWTVVLFFGGLSIPAMMMFNILPLTFLLAFIGFAMTSTGGVLALILYAE